MTWPFALAGLLILTMLALTFFPIDVLYAVHLQSLSATGYLKSPRTSLGSMVGPLNHEAASSRDGPLCCMENLLLRGGMVVWLVMMAGCFIIGASMDMALHGVRLGRFTPS